MARAFLEWRARTNARSGKVEMSSYWSSLSLSSRCESSRRKSSLAAGLILGAVVALSSPAGAQDADTYFQDAKKAYADGDVDGAYALYVKSWDLRPSPDTACNLGNVEMQLAKKRDAAEHLAYCLRTFPATGSAEQKAHAEKLLLEAKQAVGTLKLTVEPAGASVYVGDVLVGTSPLPTEIYVEAGDHAVRVEKSGFEEATESASLIPGESKDISLALAASSEGGAPPVPGEPKPGESDGKSPVIIGVGLGVGAVALGVGIGLAVAAGGKTSDADAINAQLDDMGAGECPASNEALCAEMKDARSTKDTLHNVSVVTFVAGGAVLVGTLVYVLWPGGEPEAEAGIGRVAPVVGPSQAGLSWSGAF